MLLISSQNAHFLINQMESQESTFLQWALKGEMAIKAGQLPDGITYLENAIAVGSSEHKVLSAVYNQLGNAYYKLQDYVRSNKYFFYDLTITKILKDKEGEALVCANISNVYKLQRDYTRAAEYAELQLQIGIELDKKDIQGKALNSLGTIFLCKGKEAGKSFKSAVSALNISMGSQDGTQCTMKEDTMRAIEYFNERLALAEELNDRRAVCLTYGFLGNCYYVLRDFEQSIEYQTKKLEIAKEFDDKEAQRKAYCSMGNAYMMLKDLNKGLECQRLALALNCNPESSNARLRRFSVSDSELSGRNRRMSIVGEDFFDMINRIQSQRLDEQRCDAPLPLPNDTSSQMPLPKKAPSPNESMISSESKKSYSLINKFSKTLRGHKPLLTSTPLAKHFSSHEKLNK